MYTAKTMDMTNNFKNKTHTNHIQNEEGCTHCIYWLKRNVKEFDTCTFTVQSIKSGSRGKNEQMTQIIKIASFHMVWNISGGTGQEM